ncbi:putative DNA ligase-like protein [compost metagenome]
MSSRLSCSPHLTFVQTNAQNLPPLYCLAPRYIFDPKIDGHRLIFSQQDGVVRLYTRHNNDCTRQYPEISGAVFPHDIVLDGEIACVDSVTSVSDFEAMMQRFSARRADKIARFPLRYRPIMRRLIFYAIKARICAGCR